MDLAAEPLLFVSFPSPCLPTHSHAQHNARLFLPGEAAAAAGAGIPRPGVSPAQTTCSKVHELRFVPEMRRELLVHLSLQGSKTAPHTHKPSPRKTSPCTLTGSTSGLGPLQPPPASVCPSVAQGIISICIAALSGGPNC